MTSAALRRRVTNLAASDSGNCAFPLASGRGCSKVDPQPRLDGCVADRSSVRRSSVCSGHCHDRHAQPAVRRILGYGKQGVFYNACALPESDDKEDAVCPVAVILSTAMALRHSMGLEWEARCIEKAVAKVLSLGRTADLHQPSLPTVSSSVFTAYIAQTAAEYISSSAE